MSRRVNLGVRFALLLLLVFVIGIILSGAALYLQLRAMVESSVDSNGLLLLHAMNAVRSYTNDMITPLFGTPSTAEGKFIPQAVPAFSARSTFSRLHNQESFQDLTYKEASDNPTAPEDTADPFENQLLQALRADRSKAEISGFRTLNGQPVFYTARPMAVTNPACLACHTTPDVAPQGQVATYGAASGFGWKLNDVVAAQIVYVPAAAVYDRSRNTWLAVMAILAVCFAIAVLATNWLLRRSVLHPISQVAELAQELTDDTIDESSPARLATVASRPDELGQMARVFQKMAQEVWAREQMLKRQVEAMRMEIDEAKKARQVREVVETDQFRSLQTKAEEMRRRRREQDSGRAPSNVEAGSGGS